MSAIGDPVTAEAARKKGGLTNGRTPGPHKVNFLALDGSMDLTVMMGDGPATLTGGAGGWREESRRGLAPVTWWEAPDAYRQTIPILLDGQVSWEGTIQALHTLKRPKSGTRQPPPSVAIAGQAIHRADLTWVVEDIEEGTNVIREASHGDRIRQDLTVKLLQYNAVEVIVERSPSLKSANEGTSSKPSRGRKTYRVTAADHSLAQIAGRKDIYGDPNQWKRIANANGIRDPRSIKIGQVLKIPR